MAARGGLNRPLALNFKGLLIMVMVIGLTLIEILCREMRRCVYLTRDKICCFPNCDGGIVKFIGKEEKQQQQKHESTTTRNLLFLTSVDKSTHQCGEVQTKVS